MKVALVIPPSPFLFEPLTFPPLGPLYVSAYLKQHGCDVSVLDYTSSVFCDWHDVEEVEVIGVTGTTPQFSKMVEFAHVVKTEFKNKILVAGGPHASSDPQSCLEAGFNYVVVGDGEKAFLNIINHGSASPIVYDSVKNLDSLPFPDREAIDIKRYKYKIDGLEATSVITTRGCPFSCAFCCHWPGYQTVRYRSPKNVVDELQFLMGTYGIERFMFWDDEFNLNRKRTLTLCQAFKPLKIKWRCFIRADLFDATLGKAMKEAGCVEVGCGVESGSQRVLNNIHKGTTVYQNTEARRICKELGIRFKAFTIVGNAGETNETCQETLDWLKKNEPDDFDVTVNVPFPGSPQWEHPERYDIIFDKKAIRRSLYSTTFYKGPPKSLVATSHLSPEEIVEWRDRIEDECGRRIRSRWLWERGGPKR